VQIRVERYNSLTSEMPLSEALSKSHTGFAPKSPALSLKTNNVATAHPSHISLQAARTGGAGGGQSGSQQQQQQQDTASPYLGPAGQTNGAAPAAADGVWTATEGLRELALSANEPRYFPGVVTRGHRRDSKRQDSVHESDAGEKKGRARGGSEVKE
jgi:AMP deaminase